ncbi:MAG: hypothetical protein KF886_12515 [Candidatus Hydrogenedentes bacterium]|nr:hypothetical protein [Candidatus Hydrogenedentota bacterium]
MRVAFVAMVLLALCTHGAAFENAGALDAWDFLDYEGDVRAGIVQLDDCPPGYGPEAIRLSGTLALLLAKDARLPEGTWVALYRERAAATEDADGVILFGAAFGDRLDEEHNTKTMRPHLWLEQDNDTGLSFREATANGEDRALAEAIAEGLVTDAWNETGWIWQKVHVAGDTVRAKYWPAHRPEPEGWTLELNHPLPGDRFGIRINSGAIDLAWYAAAPDDITVTAPPNYPHLPRATVASGEAVPLTLYSLRDDARTTSFTVTVERDDGSPVTSGSLDLALPAGPGRFSLALTPPGAVPPPGSMAIPLDAPLPQGAYRVQVRTGDIDAPVSRSIRVETENELLATLRARAALLDALDNAHGLDRAAIETRQVARDLLEFATGLYEAGKRDGAGAALRYVDETLAELHGIAGAFLRASGATIDWEAVPTAPLPPAADEAGQNKTDHFRTEARLRFGPPECNAASFVMGQSYTVRIPFEVVGGAPDAHYTIGVALRDPLGVRTVATAEITPDPPTSQWRPDTVYWQEAQLTIPRDDAVKKVAQPTVLDEPHDLIVSVRDPQSGAFVLLENDPGPQPDRIGHGYAAGRFYVSSAPIEIVSVSVSRESKTIAAEIANHGQNRELIARLRLIAPSGAPVFEALRPIKLPEGARATVSVQAPLHYHGVTTEVQIWEGSALLTEARQRDETPPAFSVVRENTVRTREGRPVTLLHFTPVPGAPPLDITIEARGRTLFAVPGIIGSDATVELPLPPHFGNYDITATSRDTVWHQRIVATVVETRDGQLLVNGEPFIVKGVNVHAMDPHSPARTRLMMRILKDLGFNALRGDYPPRWQVDLAEEIGLTYSLLAPFSVASTEEIFTRQDGPRLGTARALTRLFIARYRDAAGALLWNACNEITGDNIPFLLAQHPLYRLHDPYARPVHYANLYGQDLWQGQDVMGVNYYFAETQRAADRQPLIARSAAIAREHGLPMIYTEYNSYHGAIPTTGVEAMEDLFTWGVEEAGMAGGFFYMMPDSDRHPGVFDNGYNTHRITNDAFHRAFDDAELHVTGRDSDGAIIVEIRNRRPFTLRNLVLDLSVSGFAVDCPQLPDLAPGESTEARISRLPTPGPQYSLEGTLSMETHHGLAGRMPVRLFAAN